jgi:hypothetical protein
MLPIDQENGMQPEIPKPQQPEPESFVSPIIPVPPEASPYMPMPAPSSPMMAANPFSMPYPPPLDPYSGPYHSIPISRIRLNWMILITLVGGIIGFFASFFPWTSVALSGVSNNTSSVYNASLNGWGTTASAVAVGCIFFSLIVSIIRIIRFDTGVLPIKDEIIHLILNIIALIAVTICAFNTDKGVYTFFDPTQNPPTLIASGDTLQQIGTASFSPSIGILLSLLGIVMILVGSVFSLRGSEE